MTVCGKRFVYGLSEIEIIYYRSGTEIDRIVKNSGDFFVGDNTRAESIYVLAKRTRNAYRISDLNFAFFGKSCRNNIFRSVSCCIACAAVDLCRILSRKSAAAVSAVTAVCIYDYLSARKSAVACGTAYYKTSRGIYIYFRIRIYKVCGNNGFYYISITSFLIVSRETSGLCWVDTTMFASLTGVSPSYSTVTCVLPSGRR